MIVPNAEGEEHSSNSLDIVESPRRSTVNESSARKSWRLIDRRTDQEVLQEMGVSILDTEENEINNEAEISAVLKNALKRKRDIENVNPVTQSLSPKKAKYSPRSPRNKLCGSKPGPSKSPRSVEKVKPLQPTDQNLLETTMIEHYLVDEETPLGQSVSGTYLHANVQTQSSCTSSGKKKGTLLGIEEELIITRRSKCQPDGEDSFQVLSDEMILSVFRWLPKRTLTNCMLVCKRWYQVACDETLWQRLDLGNKTLSTDALGRILRRKPIILRLASSDISPWHPTTPVEQSRLQYLDLSMATLDTTTLAHLLERCCGVRKLSLESVVVDDRVCEVIGKCRNLETLNLTMAQGLTEGGIKLLLKDTSSLQSLNASWCGLTETALETLVDNLPGQLQRLNLAGARPLPDDLIPRLTAQCPRLTELDLSDCPALGAAGVRSLCQLPRLQHLALSRCYLLPPKALTKLNTMPSLQYLEVWGMLQTASLNALRSALPSIQINQFMFSAIARPTVGTRRTSIWGLRTRD